MNRQRFSNKDKKKYVCKVTLFNSTIGNRNYTPTACSKCEIFQNHASVLDTLNTPGHTDGYELPYLYLIPKLHKIPYKQRFVDGSKIFLQNLTDILTAVRERLQMHCVSVYARIKDKQMWILNNSKRP
jgi:hypothetical protein